MPYNVTEPECTQMMLEMVLMRVDRVEENSTSLVSVHPSRILGKINNLQKNKLIDPGNHELFILPYIKQIMSMTKPVLVFWSYVVLQGSAMMMMMVGDD